MNDDFIPKQFQDPYDRLEELELLVVSQGLALEQASEQIKGHAFLIEQIADTLKHMSRGYQGLSNMNHSLQQQAQNLHHRIAVLEKKETK